MTGTHARASDAIHLSWEETTSERGFGILWMFWHETRATRGPWQSPTRTNEGGLGGLLNDACTVVPTLSQPTTRPTRHCARGSYAARDPRNILFPQVIAAAFFVLRDYPAIHYGFRDLSVCTR